MDSYAYFPQRITGGSIASDGLEVILRERKELLPWDKIRMMFLGIVHEPRLEGPTSIYMRLRESASNAMAFLGLSMGQKENENKRLKTEERVYVEIFTADEERPYRIESTSLNYRGFLPEVNYISENNLKKFLTILMEKLPSCKFDNSFWAFLANQKGSVAKYNNIYEFQRECLSQWKKAKGEAP